MNDQLNTPVFNAPTAAAPVAAPVFTLDYNEIQRKRQEFQQEAMTFLGEEKGKELLQLKEAVNVGYAIPAEARTRMYSLEKELQDNRIKHLSEPKKQQFKALAEELTTAFGMKTAELVAMLKGKEPEPTAVVLVGSYSIKDLGITIPADKMSKATEFTKNDKGEVFFNWTIGKKGRGSEFKSKAIEAIKAKGFAFAEKAMPPEFKASLEVKAQYGKGKGKDRPFGFVAKRDFVETYFKPATVDLETGAVNDKPTTKPATKTAK